METRGTGVRVLAALLVLSLCGLARAVDGAGLVAHWEFDEGEGSTAYDSAGDNDGTVYGATWTAGILNGALSFDGLHDYVRVNDNASLDGMPAVSLTAWVKTGGGREEMSAW